MITATRSFPVNPHGQVRLTRSDVWAGLQSKARNALPYVPPMTRCEVIEEYPDGLLREIDIRDETHTERITFYPETLVRFERVSGPTRGYLLNAIDEAEDGELALRFTFELANSSLAEGSDAEREYFAKIEESYADTVLATLQRIRDLRGGETA